MIIQNATFATASGVYHGDILVRDGKIAEIAFGGQTGWQDDEMLDATGYLVLPGGVDVHTHLDIDVGIARSSDDFYTGTVAAACGGTTCVVDHMGFGPSGCSLLHQLEVYHKLACDKAVVDYSFHGVIQHLDDQVLADMAKLIDEGITSHKVYLTYGYRLSDADVFAVLQRAASLGTMTTVHPENDGVINYLKQQFLRDGKTQALYHAKSRPTACETEAIGRMIAFAELADAAPLYIVHLSNGDGLSLIAQARQRGARNIYVETCPQYLLLDESCYTKPNGEGLKYVMSPPLREKLHQEALFEGLANGTIDTIATDHCPFFFETQKKMGLNDFTKCPGGAPGVELRMALLYCEGVQKGRITVEQFVDLTATKPSKLFGLYPKKGTIAVGSDADFVLFNENKSLQITHKMLHENVDYTPYEGMKLTAYPAVTIARGEIIAKDGAFIGKKGRGQFVKRGLPIL